MRREELIAHYQAGTLLSALYQCVKAKPKERVAIAAELAQLHNEGSIDIVSAFNSLTKAARSTDFFVMRRLFEEALPNLTAPLRPVMECVLHLFIEAGNDGAAGLVFRAFYLFCERNSARPIEALSLIETTPALAKLLGPAIDAGAKLNEGTFLDHTLRLMQHEAPEIRRASTQALGLVQWSGIHGQSQAFLEALAKVIEIENENSVVAAAALSCARLLKEQRLNFDEAFVLIRRSLSGSDAAITAAAAEVFMLLSNSLALDSLKEIAARIRNDQSAANWAFLIDGGLLAVFEAGRTDDGLAILNLLLAEPTSPIQIDALDSTAAYIMSNQACANRLATQWLLSGEIGKGNALQHLCISAYPPTHPLEISTPDVNLSDTAEVIFLSKKIIGFLFFSPINATSMLISLILHAPDTSTRDAIGALLFDPILINYTGSVRAFVVERAAKGPVEIANVLNNALSTVDNYLAGLRQVGEIPEFRPSEAHQAAARRHMEVTMEAQMQEAEKHSIMALIASKVIILYGRKAVSRRRTGEGNPARIETAMNEHRFEYEIPRKEILDPVSLSIALGSFRSLRRR